MMGHKSLVIFTSQWAGYALQLITSVIVARVMGPDAVGHMGFSLSVIGIFYMVTSIGLGQAHQKKMAEGMDPGLCYSTFATLLLGLNAIAIIAVIASYPLIAPMLDQEGRIAFFIFLGWQTLNSFNSMLGLSLLAEQRFVSSAILTATGRSARLIAVCVLLTYHPTLVALAVCFLVEGVVTMVLGVSLTRVIQRWKRPTAESIDAYWRYAKPLAVTSPLGAVTDNMDRIILGSRYGLAEVGIYNVALNIGEAAKSLPSAAITALFPRMTQDFSAKGREVLHATVTGVQRRLMAILTPLMMTAVFWAPSIIRLLYGDKFNGAGTVLAILFFTVWFIGMATPYQYVLLATERHHLLTWLAPLAMGAQAAALWFLCQRSVGLGATGAALAYLVPHLVHFPFVLHRTRKLFGLGLDRTIIGATACAVTMATVYFSLSHLQNGWPSRVVWTLISLCSYALLARSLGLWKSDDMRYISMVLNPAQMVRYVRTELAKRF